MIYSDDLYRNRLLMMKRSSKQFLRLNEMRKGTPLTMSFLVTNRCQLQCKHCFNHLKQNGSPLIPDNKEMTFDEYERLSKSMELIMKAIFSGGEPFLRDDLSEIVRIFQCNNNILHSSSSTNGQDCHKVVSQCEAILKNSKQQKFSLAFSVDGFKDEHDEIRGANTFENLQKTWLECKKLCNIYKNFDIYICTTVNSINKQRMPDFIHWCMDEMKPSMVSLLMIRQTPRDGEYLKDVSVGEYLACKNALEEEIKAGKMGDRNSPQTYITSTLCEYVYRTMHSGARSFDCFAGKYGGFIDYDGDVGVCEMTPPIANLRDYDMDFLSLWKTKHATEFRNRPEKGHMCTKCTHETEGIMPSLSFGGNEIVPLI